VTGATVQSNTFQSNVAAWSGGAICGYGTATIKANNFVGNSGTWGGAICVFATAEIAGNRLTGNAAQRCGAICVGDAGSGLLRTHPQQRDRQ